MFVITVLDIDTMGVTISCCSNDSLDALKHFHSIIIGVTTQQAVGIRYDCVFDKPHCCTIYKRIAGWTGDTKTLIKKITLHNIDGYSLDEYLSSGQEEK